MLFLNIKIITICSEIVHENEEIAIHQLLKEMADGLLMFIYLYFEAPVTTVKTTERTTTESTTGEGTTTETTVVTTEEVTTEEATTTVVTTSSTLSTVPTSTSPGKVTDRCIFYFFELPYFGYFQGKISNFSGESHFNQLGLC